MVRGQNVVWHENVEERKEAFLLNKVNCRKTESHLTMLEGQPGSVTKYTCTQYQSTYLYSKTESVWKEEAESRTQLETSTLYLQ